MGFLDSGAGDGYDMFTPTAVRCGTHRPAASCGRADEHPHA